MKRITKFFLPLLACAGLSTPAAAQLWDDAPRPPAGAAPNQLIPARDAQGNYATPNRRLSPEATSWHVRAALNVAALGCRDAAEAETIAAYNAMLVRHAASLAAADAGVKAQYRARAGAAWESEHDRDMTRVYNFFAQPPAHDRFCDAARDVLRQLSFVDTAGFADFAAYALPRLEAPFTDFYRDYDAWRAERTAWENRRAGPDAAVAAVAVVEVARTRGPSLP
jgi:hypothetical protein